MKILKIINNGRIKDNFDLTFIGEGKNESKRLRLKVWDAREDGLGRY